MTKDMDSAVDMSNDEEYMDIDYVEVLGHTKDFGHPNSDEEYVNRRARLRSKPPIQWPCVIDSRMHIGKLQLASKLHDLDALLLEGPIGLLHWSCSQPPLSTSFMA